MRPDVTPLERDAEAALQNHFGPSDCPVATALAPGRCTIVGEHVDYAGGSVLAIAVELYVAAAVRVSRDGVWRAASAGRIVERPDAGPWGDIGDRIFAAARVSEATDRGFEAAEIGVAASLPESAGLASSAAVICAVMTAVLRLQRRAVAVQDFIQQALRAERDLARISCGPLDPHAIVESQAGSALLINCADESTSSVPWPWDDVALCVCATDVKHDIAGPEYAARRDTVLGALQALRAGSCAGLDLARLAPHVLSNEQSRLLRHVCSENERTCEAAAAMRRGDAPRLGQLMSESHHSLRDDMQVSTAQLDAVVDAALRVRGCLGARLVGGGFGGSVIALVHEDGSDRCRNAMAAAGGVEASRTWLVRPTAGLAQLAEDAVGSG